MGGEWKSVLQPSDCQPHRTHYTASETSDIRPLTLRLTTGNALLPPLWLVFPTGSLYHTLSLFHTPYPHCTTTSVTVCCVLPSGPADYKAPPQPGSYGGYGPPPGASGYGAPGYGAPPPGGYPPPQAGMAPPPGGYPPPQQAYGQYGPAPGMPPQHHQQQQYGQYGAPPGTVAEGPAGGHGRYLGNSCRV